MSENPKTDVRIALEARAVAVGYDFPHNIGDEKLELRVSEAEAAARTGSDEAAKLASEVQARLAVEAQAKLDAEEQVKLNQPDAKIALGADEFEGKPHVRVVGPRAGRRRIGRAFGPEPVRILIEDLSNPEMDALVDDPMLAVSAINT